MNRIILKRIRLTSFIYLILWLASTAVLSAAPQTNKQKTGFSKAVLSEEKATDELLENLEKLEVQHQQVFGYDLFQREFPHTNFANAFFPDQYLLGPGDRIGIYLSGKIQQDFNVIVNVEGKIHIPTVGVLHVKDRTLQDFKNYLRGQLSRFYDNFRVDVMLIEPKPIQVAVVGEVNQPGKYLLTALNTVIDAVTNAGGPTQQGSLRNIELYREGRFIESIDLYDFLMRPEPVDSLFLSSNDRVFVPLSKAKVMVEGEVRRPMLFELNPNKQERVTDIIQLAGGFTDYAFLSRIEVSRMKDNGNRAIIYLDYHDILENTDHASNVVMQNDDRITIYSKLDQVHKRVVYIHGQVNKPGEYELEDNLRLSDLILKAGSLTRSAYLLEAEVAKVDPKQITTYIKVNLHELFDEHDVSQDILLEEDDRVFIRQIPEWQVGPIVEIRGEMMFPGIYSITKDSTKLSEILKKAGGFTDEALIREAKLIRQSAKITIDKEYERLQQMSRDEMTETEYQYLVMKENTSDIGQIVVDFYKLMIERDMEEDVILEDNDQIIIPKRPNVVYVTGRVSRPGGILYVPNMKLNYYLEKAGGTTWDATKKKTKVTKVSGEILDDENVRYFEPGDIIWVPRKPDRDWWAVFRQTMAVAAQVATVYLVVERAIND
ncbi:SLBB domain-containing protein [candidate division KSB1 bacterium]|nr:SLBB domain-containing protein [candidate division KSB1 bacterium]